MRRGVSGPSPPPIITSHSPRSSSNVNSSAQGSSQRTVPLIVEYIIPRGVPVAVSTRSNPCWAYSVLQPAAADAALRVRFHNFGVSHLTIRGFSSPNARSTPHSVITAQNRVQRSFPRRTVAHATSCADPPIGNSSSQTNRSGTTHFALHLQPRRQLGRGPRPLLARPGRRRLGQADRRLDQPARRLLDQPAECFSHANTPHPSPSGDLMATTAWHSL